MRERERKQGKEGKEGKAAGWRRGEGLHLLRLKGPGELVSLLDLIDLDI